jgi:hypothetical protein
MESDSGDHYSMTHDQLQIPQSLAGTNFRYS